MNRILETLKQKWAEYILEIIVIVGSILGAFFLESWNQDRLERSIELNSLQSLKQEFTNNKKVFDLHIFYKEKAFLEQSEYLDKMKKGEETVEIILKYNNDTGGNTFNPSCGVLNSLISTGSIHIIRNDSLKHALTRWGEVLSDYQEDEVLHLNFLVTTRDEYTSSLIPSRGARFHDWSETRFDEAHLSLSKELKHRNHVIKSILFLKNILLEAKTLEKRFDEILSLIDAQIAKLE